MLPLNTILFRMNKYFFPLLAIIALMTLASCGGGTETPVELSIVPNPVSIQGFGRGLQLKPGAEPTVRTRIDAKLAPEAYILKVRRNKVVITGGSQAGVFWGRQTLAQILAQ